MPRQKGVIMSYRWTSFSILVLFLIFHVSWAREFKQGAIHPHKTHQLKKKEERFLSFLGNLFHTSHHEDTATASATTATVPSIKPVSPSASKVIVSDKIEGEVQVQNRRTPAPTNIPPSKCLIPKLFAQNLDYCDKKVCKLRPSRATLG